MDPAKQIFANYLEFTNFARLMLYV